MDLKWPDVCKFVPEWPSMAQYLDVRLFKAEKGSEVYRGQAKFSLDC